MEIFEKIGDAASKTYKFTAEKTSKIAKETKLKMQINEHKGDIKDIYVEIGEAVYEKFVKDEELDLKEIEQQCEEIQVLSEKIVKCKDEILKLKEKKQCPNCYEEIELEANYCPNCGFKQESIEEKIEEDEEAIKVSEEDNIQEETKEDNSQEDDE